MSGPIRECDLEAVERLLAASLALCGRLAAEDRHAEAGRSAAGAIRLMRTMDATQAEHGFIADLALAPFRGAFDAWAAWSPA